MINSRSLLLLGIAPLWFSSAFQANSRQRISTKFFPRGSNVFPTASTVSLNVAVPFDDSTSIGASKDSKLHPKDAWIANLDYEAFGKEVTELGKELRASTGEADVDHLYKIVQWRNIAAFVGLATVWATPNPITILALSTWTYSSWAMIAHHTCHGGYNRVDAGRYKSRGFALGLANRFIDWLDWMQPEAWNVEHNRLHHYSLNEGKDPDLVQRNLGFLRDNKRLPMLAKYATVLAFLPIWKWFYYAPNTFKELKINELLKASDGSEKVFPENFDREEAATVVSLLEPFTPHGRALRKVVPPHELFLKVLGPMLLGRYLAIPALFFCLAPSGMGPVLAGHTFWNLLAAELLTNVHAFVTIVTNHAGEDLYTFEDSVKPNTGSFYVRQIIGSTNYATGSDPVDFSHGWLNYQIEHHVWPDLSMLQYQKGAPKLKEICDRHGVPYTQENVFERLRKTVDIMVGKTSMRAFPTDAAYEPLSDKTRSGTYWTSTNGAIEEQLIAKIPTRRKTKKNSTSLPHRTSSSSSSSGIAEKQTKKNKSTPFVEVVLQQQHQEKPPTKGILERTLERVSSNPFLTCGSIDTTTNTTATTSKSRGLLQCGIHPTDSKDDEYEFEFEYESFDLDDWKVDVHNNNNNNDILLKRNDTQASQSPSKGNTSKRSDRQYQEERTKRKQQTKRRKSLYRKTMMTAATNNDGNASDAAAQHSSSSPSNAAQQHLQKTARLARGFADDAGRAIGNLLPKASLQNLTARKYTLPDKTVASQVLMYRQLLHTKCRPGLKLSRNYEETPAQKAVMHMPWWEQGIEESRKMVISYDNLITRLWMNGAIHPFADNNDLLALDGTAAGTETLLGDDGLPPVPHKFWVDRLGFQQPDPVTDFRSGGVLSLAMMVYMVESKPEICRRFFLGDTKVLPFGITCINVTDMIAKFLMLAKSTDRMDALLSQKPFWKMFADPNAITAVQELAMSMLCDVAYELGEEKKIPYLAQKTNTNEGMAEAKSEVTVFDFSTILERTETRVRDDLLGAGPKTVDELRSIERRLQLKYKTQLERKIQKAKEKSGAAPATPTAIEQTTNSTATEQKEQADQLKEAMDKASHFAGGLFAKVKSGVTKGRESITNTLQQQQQAPQQLVPTATLVDLPPPPTATTTTATTNAETSSGNSSDEDWTTTDIAAATDGITNFSIGDDDDDDADLLL